jgi:cytosine/adenosine deaminase-related metal-dependent hydrolase
MAAGGVTVYCGLLVDSRPDWSLRLEEGILVLAGTRILERTGRADLAAVVARHALPPDRVVHLRPGQFLLPGLVDTHIHASQFPNAGGCAKKEN